MVRFIKQIAKAVSYDADRDFYATVFPGSVEKKDILRIRKMHKDDIPAVIEIEKPNLEIIPKAKITRFEKSRLVGTRAMQIENNENILINPGKEFNSVKIALMEYEQGLLPIFIIRKYPNGEIEKIFPTLDNI